MTTSNTKWFCRDCWRHGVSEHASIELCQSDHDMDVRADMKAYRIPSGMEVRARGSAMMLKFPGVQCIGRVTIGERQGKPQYSRPALPQFDFGEASISQTEQKG